MRLPRLGIALCVLAAAAACSSNQAAPPSPPADPNSTVLIGTTPAGEAIVSVLKLPADIDSAVKWRLALHRDPGTQQPAGYDLRCDTETTVPNTNGKRKETHATERKGTWEWGSGRSTDQGAVIVKLVNGLSLVQLNENIFHLLNEDRSLMIGGGGWSYTLYRESTAEPPVKESEVEFPPSDSYKLTPLASGPEVYGIYLGRSPIAGIWRELRRPNPMDAMKAKWRLTLLKDPQTGAPTKYRIDGTMYREGLMKDPQEPREGTWTISEHPSTKAIVYELGPWKSEPGLKLLCGDDNVLFILDASDKLMVGSADFSYTLNRSDTPPQTAAAKR
jgi:hypothetical protein